MNASLLKCVHTGFVCVCICKHTLYICSGVCKSTVAGVQIISVSLSFLFVFCNEAEQHTLVNYFQFGHFFAELHFTLISLFLFCILYVQH